jgi:hypothetical protein
MNAVTQQSQAGTNELAEFLATAEQEAQTFSPATEAVKSSLEIATEITEITALECLHKIAELTARRTEVEDIMRKKTQHLQNEVDECNTEIGILENMVKQFTLKRGKSFKGKFLQTVYSKGKTTWDTNALDGYAVINPDILRFKKTGTPSVSIRAITEAKKFNN